MVGKVTLPLSSDNPAALIASPHFPAIFSRMYYHSTTPSSLLLEFQEGGRGGSGSCSFVVLPLRRHTVAVVLRHERRHPSHQHTVSMVESFFQRLAGLAVLIYICVFVLTILPRTQISPWTPYISPDFLMGTHGTSPRTPSRRS